MNIKKTLLTIGLLYINCNILCMHVSNEKSELFSIENKIENKNDLAYVNNENNILEDKFIEKKENSTKFIYDENGDFYRDQIFPFITDSATRLTARQVSHNMNKGFCNATKIYLLPVKFKTITVDNYIDFFKFIEEHGAPDFCINLTITQLLEKEFPEVELVYPWPSLEKEEKEEILGPIYKMFSILKQNFNNKIIKLTIDETFAPILFENDFESETIQSIIFVKTLKISSNSISSAIEELKPKIFTKNVKFLDIQNLDFNILIDKLADISPKNLEILIINDIELDSSDKYKNLKNLLNKNNSILRVAYDTYWREKDIIFEIIKELGIKVENIKGESISEYSSGQREPMLKLKFTPGMGYGMQISLLAYRSKRLKSILNNLKGIKILEEKSIDWRSWESPFKENNTNSSNSDLYAKIQKRKEQLINQNKQIYQELSGNNESNNKNKKHCLCCCFPWLKCLKFNKK